jgi:hypothetical protein
MDSPIVAIFALVMGIVWIIFPFVVMRRLDAIKDELVKHTAEMKFQSKTLTNISHRVLKLLPPDDPEHTRIV